MLVHGIAALGQARLGAALWQNLAGVKDWDLSYLLFCFFLAGFNVLWCLLFLTADEECFVLPFYHM